MEASERHTEVRKTSAGPVRWRPPVRPAEVQRTDLLVRLEDQRDRPIVLVTAPAGYGKSIFAAQWCATDPTRSTAWVALNEAHDDPVVLLSDVMAAVPGRAEVDPVQVASMLASSAAGTGTQALRRALGGVPPFALVLDDVHRVTSPLSTVLLQQVLDALPEGCQAILASREDPDIGIPRRRANGELVEVRTDLLAMDLLVTRQYLAAANVALSIEAATELHSSTEGWPAGIGLAALAHQGLDRSTRSAPGPTRVHRDIGDYLVDEVLVRQDPAMHDFLLRTSVLSRFSAELCDAVLGTTSSADLIRQMERTNLFVIPLDEHRGWYRYHHLFQDLLTAELDRTLPGARRSLVRAAAAWHEEHGTVEEALRYAQEGGDHALTGRLVLRNWQAYGTRGQIETLRAWVSRSSDAEISSDPTLAIGAAWVNMLLGDTERAERYAAAAAQHNLDAPSPDGASSIRTSLANLRSGLGTGGIRQMLDDGRLVQEAEQAGRTRWLVGGTRAVGIAQLLLGNLDAAVAALDEAVLLTEHRPELRFVRIFCLGYLSLALLEREDVDRARAVCDAALELAQETTVLQTFQALPARTAHAALLARGSDPGAARSELTAIAALFGVTEAAPWMLADLAVRNAETALELGEPETARDLVADAQRALVRLPDGGTIPERLNALERRTQSTDALADTLTPAERRVLQQLATHRTLGEIGDELYISRSTVKTHVRAIYSKLGVASRAEAVARLP